MSPRKVTTTFCTTSRSFTNRPKKKKQWLPSSLSQQDIHALCYKAHISLQLWVQELRFFYQTQDFNLIQGTSYSRMLEHDMLHIGCSHTEWCHHHWGYPDDILFCITLRKKQHKEWGVSHSKTDMSKRDRFFLLHHTNMITLLHQVETSIYFRANRFHFHLITYAFSSKSTAIFWSSNPSLPSTMGKS